VGLAARGQREGERGVESVGDNWLVRQLRRQAREVLVEGALGAAMLTGLVLMLPG
jgi:hypothetical protein